MSLTCEIVNEILEGCDSDRTVSLSEDGQWVLVTTEAFYEQDGHEADPTREQEGDVVAQFRVYPHEHGIHHALMCALEITTGYWPISRYCEHLMDQGEKVLIGCQHWPAIFFNEGWLRNKGYEISEYPWVQKIDQGGGK